MAPGSMTPMRGIFDADCCACTASGQVAAAPPSAASNSRRPMVTVIRPPRARCVKATIPRHERAVLTARHPARAGAHAGHRLQLSAAWPEDSGLISRGLSSAAPLHFISDLREDIDARGFL